MDVTQATLIKTINGKNGQVFTLMGGRRIPLAECNVKIRIYEEKREIPTLGRNAQVKTYHAALTLCKDINKKVDLSDVNVGYFEIQTDIEVGYSKFEKILLDKLAAVELNNIDVWTFEIIDVAMIEQLLKQ